MKNLACLFILVSLVSCGSSRVITTKDKNYQKPDNSEVVTSDPKTTPAPEPPKPPQTPTVTRPQSTAKDKVVRYIENYRDIAVAEMKDYGIPASITLAQGILESGAGDGDLTRRANNHFGIKCHGWTGEKVYHDDDKKGECFRKYADPAQSFKDHSLFLVNRKRYAGLFKLKKSDYKGWAKGLKAAGYATDPKYPNKLITIIEKYELYNYDDGNIALEEVKEEVIENENENEVAEETTVVSEEKPIVDSKSYIVKKGDTLYSIARKFEITVEDIMAMNNLSSPNIGVDQVLKVKK